MKIWCCSTSRWPSAGIDRDSCSHRTRQRHDDEGHHRWQQCAVRGWSGTAGPLAGVVRSGAWAAQLRQSDLSPGLPRRTSAVMRGCRLKPGRRSAQLYHVRSKTGGGSAITEMHRHIVAIAPESVARSQVEGRRYEGGASHVARPTVRSGNLSTVQFTVKRTRGP